MITVKDLREELDKLEKLWTKEDLKYLGKFEDCGIYVDAFDPNQNMKFGGIGRSKLPQYFGEFGICFFAEENNFNLDSLDILRLEKTLDTYKRKLVATKESLDVINLEKLRKEFDKGVISSADVKKLLGLE